MKRLIWESKPALDLSSVTLMVTRDDYNQGLASSEWKCVYLRDLAFPQHIHVSVDATPDDIMGFFLSEEGRRAVEAISTAARQKVMDNNLMREAEKVRHSAASCD